MLGFDATKYGLNKKRENKQSDAWPRASNQSPVPAHEVVDQFSGCKGTDNVSSLTEHKVDKGVHVAPAPSKWAYMGTQTYLDHARYKGWEKIATLMSKDSPDVPAPPDQLTSPTAHKPTNKATSLVETCARPESWMIEQLPEKPADPMDSSPLSTQPRTTTSHKVSSQDIKAPTQSTIFHLAQTNLLDHTISTGMEEDMNETLRLAQEGAAQVVHSRIARKSKFESTSLKDLDLARRAVDPKRPKASRRVWAPDEDYSASPQNVHVGEDTMDSTRDKTYLAQSTGGNMDSVARGRSASMNLAKQQAGPSEEQPNKRTSRWAMKEEMACEKVEVDSHAWGSQAPSNNPSDATRDDNLSHTSFGKLLNKKDREHQPEGLPVDYKGRPLPPPPWDSRQRFNNNTTNFRQAFKQWQASIGQDEKADIPRFCNGNILHSISERKLAKDNLVPDGISLVDKCTTIDASNALFYGYEQNPVEATRYADMVDSDAFEDWAKLDPEHPSSFRNDETTESLVRNWNKHRANARRDSLGVTNNGTAPVAGDSLPPQEHMVHQNHQKASESEGAIDKPTFTPKLNLYLRPATTSDLVELTRIYNWHILHSPRPCETSVVAEKDMLYRLETSQASKLPFIVAAPKKQNRAMPIDLEAEAREYQESTKSRPVKNIAQKYRAITRTERLVGFCSVADLTAPDFVEHISTEVEIYVDHQYRHMGVGKCLLDKMLEICDRGYIRRGSYPFTCAPESRHLYGSGGGHDIHKILFLIRVWQAPRSKKHDSVIMKVAKGADEEPTKENDYNTWLKKWLETSGFTAEAHLKGLGAKNGRFLDLIYMTKFTSWQPAEGHVPDPLPFGDDDDDDDDDDD